MNKLIAMDSVHSVKQIEEEAVSRMHRVAKSYYQSGGNANITLRDNLDAFDNVKLNRSAEVDIQKFSGIETTILGQKVASPICIVSTAY